MRRQRRSSSTRWQASPVRSGVVSVLAFVAPVAVSILAAVVTAKVLPRANGGSWLILWWVAVLLVPILVYAGADRLSRRLLPLAVLLKMTMVFPDRAPKRLSVARRAGSTRDLARRIEDATAHGPADDPTLAAEQILALAASLSAHDRLTRGHSERVRALTDLVAEELGLPSADRDRLRWSALLHDIGKLTVHPHVLNKTGELSDAEWEELRKHPLEGARLTSRLSGWLGEWANTIAEHHEKFDGTGYPFGLSGSEISFGGRIVAVADSYDAMTAVRSYNKVKSPTAARAELAACAGTHFDPQVVRAFLQVSVGRLRLAGGPLSWLGALPFLNAIPGATQIAATAGRVAAASSVVLGAGAVGVVHATARPPAVAAAVPSAVGGAGASTLGGRDGTGAGRAHTVTGVPRPAPPGTGPASQVGSSDHHSQPPARGTGATAGPQRTTPTSDPRPGEKKHRAAGSGGSGDGGRRSGPGGGSSGGSSGGSATTTTTQVTKATQGSGAPPEDPPTTTTTAAPPPPPPPPPPTTTTTAAPPPPPPTTTTTTAAPPPPPTTTTTAPPAPPPPAGLCILILCVDL